MIRGAESNAGVDEMIEKTTKRGPMWQKDREMKETEHAAARNRLGAGLMMELDKVVGRARDSQMNRPRINLSRFKPQHLAVVRERWGQVADLQSNRSEPGAFWKAMASRRNAVGLGGRCRSHV